MPSPLAANGASAAAATGCPIERSVDEKPSFGKTAVTDRDAPVSEPARAEGHASQTALAEAHAARRLVVFGQIAGPCYRQAFAAHSASPRRKNCFVSPKTPFACPRPCLPISPPLRTAGPWARRAWGHLSLQGLLPQRSGATSYHDPYCRGIHPRPGTDIILAGQLSHQQVLLRFPRDGQGVKPELRLKKVSEAIAINLNPARERRQRPVIIPGC